MPFTLSNPQVDSMIDSLKRESPTPRATPPSLQPSTLLKKHRNKMLISKTAQQPCTPGGKVFNVLYELYSVHNNILKFS